MVLLTKVITESSKYAIGAAVAGTAIFVTNKIKNSASWKPWKSGFYTNKKTQA